MPIVPWVATWDKGSLPPGYPGETIMCSPSAAKSKGLYLVSLQANIALRVNWGLPEHAGIGVMGRTFTDAEYMLAALVAPELAKAYDNIQYRQPSQN